MSEQASKVMDRLREPFAPDVIGWKAQATNGNRALAVAFIDARDVMDRLDTAVGAANWQDSYTVLPDGNVVCRLSLRVEGEWVHKEDVGGESDQKDEGDKRKASFSDALKRAAVKWGIGRYLYSLPSQWVDYDPQKKQLKGTPRLPDWAIPRATARTASPVKQAEPLLTSQQVDRIDALVLQLGYSNDAFQRWCTKHWSVSNPQSLTPAQADEAIKRLDLAVRQQQAEAGEAPEREPVAVGK